MFALLANYCVVSYVVCHAIKGTLGNEWIDAQTFAAWEVDYVKYDDCYHEQYVVACSTRAAQRGSLHAVEQSRFFFFWC